MVTSRISTPPGQRVQVTLKKFSGEIWLETDPLPILLTMSHIVFDVAGDNRHDSVVPYLIYDRKVQPYWKSLLSFGSVRNGCQALEMIVVFQPIETPIASLPRCLTKRSRLALRIPKIVATWTWNA